MAKRHILIFTLATLALIVAGCSNQSGPTAPIDGSAFQLSSAIPPGATLVSASLNLYVWQVSDQTVNAHRVTADWDEMVVTWNNFAGAYDAAVEASILVDAGGYKTFDVTALVQAWLDGAVPNYGFLIEQGTTYPRSIFISREHADVNMHPVLEVCYMMGGVEVCEDLPAIADAEFWEGAPDDNYGASQTLRTGWQLATDWEKQALIRFELPGTPPPPDGCTRTKGYWYNWGGFGPQPDMVTALLPQWLGTPGGSKSILVDNGQIAHDLLGQKVYCHRRNGITKLYAQLLAAKLNITNNASGEPVATVIAAADGFLADHECSDWRRLRWCKKFRVLRWARKLDRYNNGRLGVPHCDDDDGGHHGGCGGH